MTFTNEQIIKAKSAKTAEELLRVAKAENVELTEEQAKTYFTELTRQCELSDDELNAVAGGSKSPQEYNVQANWAPDGCGCGSFSRMYWNEKDQCGNCFHFDRNEPNSLYGKCRREFDCQ